MRGRKPREVNLHPEDVPVLESLVRKGKTEQRVAKRASILLALAAGGRTASVAGHMDRDQATVWRIARRYEERGLQAVYDAARPGRPRQIPPPGTSADRESGLFEPWRPRPEFDPLVGVNSAAGGHQTRDYRHDSLQDGGPHPGSGFVAAASMALLEDDSVE
ncbi:MAG: helix-turn-helix domain-containing protein [Chloroflexi bacterium]|nr:helix-turn-helix domain-containing protein [Chloroflexota bacterium]